VAPEAQRRSRLWLGGVTYAGKDDQPRLEAPAVVSREQLVSLRVGACEIFKDVIPGFGE
jgi:hypothetical protein